MESNAVSFIAEAEEDEIDEILEGMEEVADWRMKKLETGDVRVDLKIEFGEISDVCRHLFFAFANREKALLELTSKKASLEDVFIELTEGGDTGLEDMVDTGKSMEPADKDSMVMEPIEGSDIESAEREVDDQ